jgi:hypothetical protein
MVAMEAHAIEHRARRALPIQILVEENNNDDRTTLLVRVLKRGAGEGLGEGTKGGVTVGKNPLSPWPTREGSLHDRRQRAGRHAAAAPSSLHSYLTLIWR